MGRHPEHFLSRLKRAEPEQVQFALALYHDSALVRSLLERLTLPPGCERVAIAVEDEGPGPHLILTRDGQFVTCLGAGMSVQGCHVVRRAEVEALRGVRERIVAAAARWRAGDGEEGEGDAAASPRVGWARGLRRGGRLCREEHEAMAAMVPLTWPDLVEAFVEHREAMGEHHAQVLKAVAREPRRRLLHQRSRMLVAYWRVAHALGHVAVLLGRARPEMAALLGDGPSEVMLVELARWPVMVGHVGQTLRALWAVAQHGPALLARYDRQLDAATRVSVLREAVWGLAAIGCRHPELTSQVRRSFSRHCSMEQVKRHLSSRKALPPPHDTSTLGRYRQYLCLLGHVALPAPGRGPAAQRVSLEGLRGLAVEGMQAALDRARGEAGEVEERFEAYIAAPETISRDLLLALACHQDVCFVGEPGLEQSVFVLLGEVVHAPSSALYLPRVFEERLITHWSVAFVAGYLEQLAGSRARSSKRALGTRPARNAPCPCGSGRKHRYCCGA